jgi:hypothetical protein
MRKPPLIIHWDGRSLPGELGALPAGRYIVSPDDLFDNLDEDEDRPHTELSDLQLGDKLMPAKVLARLAELAPGRYLVESADALVELTPEEEEGLLDALRSMEAGNLISHDEVMRDLRARWPDS